VGFEKRKKTKERGEKKGHDAGTNWMTDREGTGERERWTLAGN